MIVAERKTIPEILDILKGKKKVLILGCGTCVTVCLAGGEREVSVLASALRIASRAQDLDLEISELTIERQCDNEFIDKAQEAISKADVVLSLGCGAGVQAIAARTNKPVYEGLNTKFIGILEERAKWSEQCRACGDCVLHNYGGVCPVTRCAKSLLNGPCGGAKDDHCEGNPENPCAWVLIYNRLKETGELDKLKEIQKPKEWAGKGPRTIVREDHRL